MSLLDRALNHATEYLDTLRERPVISAERDAPLRRRLGGPVPEQPEDPESVLDALALAGMRGTVATAGPRYYGFVTGGSLPIAMAADWLAGAWDQNVALNVMSPLGGAVETVAADWLLEILELPRSASVGFVTGAHMANVTALAVARHQVLRQAGWDVEADGLQGAPRVTVLAGTEAHSSIGAACRLVGLGARTIVRVPSDDQGRLIPEALSAALQSSSGPRIVCAQAGNVNTGACDPFPAIVRAVREYNAWLHVDGAFGLWAAASPDRRHLVDGLSGADSWTTDGHKWLNVPYDSGIVIVANPAAHRAAMSQTAAYLTRSTDEARDGMDWVPEASRRARGIPIYAAVRQLGRAGIAVLVERCCQLAERMAARLRERDGISVLNEVVLNQVLVRFQAAGLNVTPAVIEAVQRSGVCWCGGTDWQGEPAMRIAISNWSTTESDIDRSADSIVEAFDSRPVNT